MKRLRTIVEVEHEQTVTMTIPLLIRLFEYAREDAKTDMDLHRVAERAAEKTGALCMDDYESLVKR